MELHQSILGRQSLEFVFRCFEAVACVHRNLLSDLHVEAFESVKAGADCSAPLGQLADLWEFRFDSANGLLDLESVAAELLAQSHRSGILGVRPSYFDDVLELCGFISQGLEKQLQGGEQLLLGFDNGGDMHGSGESVVARLAHIDMIIRMYFLIADLHSPGGQDFVAIHIGLGA